MKNINKTIFIKLQMKVNQVLFCKRLKRKPAGKEVLMELGLMLVAAVLLIVFRDNVKDVISDIATTVQTKIESVFTTS